MFKQRIVRLERIAPKQRQESDEERAEAVQRLLGGNECLRQKTE